MEHPPYVYIYDTNNCTLLLHNYYCDLHGADDLVALNHG